MEKDSLLPARWKVSFLKFSSFLVCRSLFHEETKMISCPNSFQGKLSSLSSYQYLVGSRALGLT